MYTVISYFVQSKFVSPQQLDDTLMAHISYSQNNPMSERFEIFLLELSCLTSWTPIPQSILTANEKLYVALSGKQIDQQPTHPQFQDLLLKTRAPLLTLSQLPRTFDQLKVLIDQLQIFIANPSTLPSPQQLPPQFQNQNPLDRCKSILSHLQSAVEINQQISSQTQPQQLNAQLYSAQKISSRQFAQFQKGQLSITTGNHLIAVAPTGPIQNGANPSSVLSIPTTATIPLHNFLEKQHRVDNGYGVGIMVPHQLLPRSHVESPLTDGFVPPSCKPQPHSTQTNKTPPIGLNSGRLIPSMLHHQAELRAKYEPRDIRLCFLELFLTYIKLTILRCCLF